MTIVEFYLLKHIFGISYWKSILVYVIVCGVVIFIGVKIANYIVKKRNKEREKADDNGRID